MHVLDLKFQVEVPLTGMIFKTRESLKPLKFSWKSAEEKRAKTRKTGELYELWDEQMSKTV